MKPEPVVTLYHLTNRINADLILESALGFDLTDYEQLCLKVRDYFNVPHEILAHEVPPDIPECQGRVWFYTSFKDAITYHETYKREGIHKREYLERLIRRCTRFTGIPYRQARVVAQTLSGELSEPVVIEVNVSVSLLQKPSFERSLNELYIDQKLSIDCISKIISMG